MANSGPKAASETGKPSAEAHRFLEETTGADRPRVYRNAVVLAVPSREALDVTRGALRDYLAWEEVRSQLERGDLDPIREATLLANLDTARKRVPEGIRQAYCVVVTVSDKNEVQAFKVMAGDDPLFTSIKGDARSRIQETAVSADALLPGGPYDLWREGETSRRVKDLRSYFSGDRIVKVKKGGYDEPVRIPKADSGALDSALREAVKAGSLWLTAGPASVLGEDVPAGVLTEDAVVQAPPPPVGVYDLLVERLPEAWEGQTTTALGLALALFERRQGPSLANCARGDRWRTPRGSSGVGG